MGAKFRDSRVLPGPVDHYLEKIRNIYAAGLKYGVLGEQPTPGGVVVSLNHGYTPSSWGENLRITLTSQGGGTGVEIYSECAMPTQLFDLGRNKKNVAEIFDYLQSGAPQQGYAQPQQGYSQPQQNFEQPQQNFEQPRQAGGFCPNCGAAVGGNANFCPGCGSRLK